MGMWSPWLLRSPSRVHRSKSHPSNFSCSSFKDIHTLVHEEPEPDSHSHSHSGNLSPRTTTIFHRVRISNSNNCLWAIRNETTLTLPDDDRRVVVYYTSLRVVRRTFEDCRAVRSILRGLRVTMDERDVSLDAQYLHELQGIIGGKNMNLPLVFIGRRYIGEAEEIKKLYETGELKRLIQGLPLVESNGCDFCGGVRYVVCNVCDGSHKVYTEKTGFRTCTNCSESGLIRCSHCSCVKLRHSQHQLNISQRL